jgi:hypothetical protein
MVKVGSTPIVAGADDLVGVTTWVRGRLVPSFQEGAFRLLQELSGSVRESEGDYSPPFPNTHGPKDAWELPRWEAQDLDPARWILQNLGPKQRRIIAGILAAGVDGIWTGDLRRFSGYDDAISMSGVYKAIGGRFRRVGRRPVWNGGEKESQKGQRLNVADPTAMHLFRELLLQDYPELAEEAGINA